MMLRLIACLSSALALAGVFGADVDGEGDCLSAMQMPRSAARQQTTNDLCNSVSLMGLQQGTSTAGGSLEALPAEAVRPKIFDFFLFGFPAEIPVLELRLAEMADSVDGIFIVEGNKDFQGNPREMLLRTLIHEEPLSNYADKLFIIEVDVPEISQDHDQYGGTYSVQLAINSMIYVAGDIVAATPGVDLSRDMIIQSDLDEIIGRQALGALKQCRPAAAHMPWPLMMTDMDLFQDGFRHRLPQQWALGPVLGPVNEVLGCRSRPEDLPSHAVFDGSGNPLEATTPTSVQSGSSFFLGSSVSKSISSTKGVQHPTDVKLIVTDHLDATAWHMSWSLSDEGTARKLHARAGGLPNWAVGLDDDALVREVHHRRLTSTPLFDEQLYGIFRNPRRLPEAVKQDPERFRSFLTDFLAESLE